jgi:hypothetical protein
VNIGHMTCRYYDYANRPMGEEFISTSLLVMT